MLNLMNPYGFAFMIKNHTTCTGCTLINRCYVFVHLTPFYKT